MISVIVTSYNKSEYIEKCIESIENNTYKDLEIIIVEDCSTDNSLDIINRLIKKYDNIRLIKNDINHGAGYSRNIGVKNSNGDYISFIDADDYISKDYYQTYIDNMEDDIDIVFGECLVTYDNDKKVVKLYNRINNIYNNLNHKLLFCIKDLNFQFLNISLIRKELFNKVDYCKERFIEDVPTAYLLLYHSKKIKTINFCGYYYKIIKDSLMHSNKRIQVSLNYSYNMIDVIEYIRKRDKELSCYIFNNVYNSIKDIFLTYEVDYDDVAKIFNGIDRISEYYNISKEYMHNEKILSRKLSKTKVIKIR